MNEIRISVEDAKLLLVFLARSSMQGSEVQTFVRVVSNIELQMVALAEEGANAQ